jgi:hypothetical protein
LLAAALVAGSLVGGHAAGVSGTWSGLANYYAPSKGTITVTGGPGKAATCTVRGKTGSASGDGWVFRGKATVEETSCEGRIDGKGRLSVTLKLRMEWRGRVKATGGDWEDVEGSSSCDGNLEGTLTSGGVWKAKCKNDNNESDTSFEWKPD